MIHRFCTPQKKPQLSTSMKPELLFVPQLILAATNNEN